MGDGYPLFIYSYRCDECWNLGWGAPCYSTRVVHHFPGLNEEMFVAGSIGYVNNNYDPGFPGRVHKPPSSIAS